LPRRFGAAALRGMTMRPTCVFALGLAIVVSAAPAMAGERTERFDRDPGWEGMNNRSPAPAARTVRQDFGYSPATKNAGGATGEVGGFITPAAEPAYYARKLEPKSFKDAFSASGRLMCKGDRKSTRLNSSHR